MDKIKVAVYGSLLSGLGNHRLLDTSEKIGEERINIPFKMVTLGAFPGLVSTEENHSIVVEIYEVDQETFRRLDGLEGYPHFYNRVQVQTSIGEAWIYFLKDNEYAQQHLVVDSGNWKEYINNKQNVEKYNFIFS